MNTCPICNQEIEGQRCANLGCAMFAATAAELDQVRAVIEAAERAAFERARDEAVQLYINFDSESPRTPGIKRDYEIIAMLRAMQYRPASPAPLSAADEAEQVEREKRRKM